MGYGYDSYRPAQELQNEQSRRSATTRDGREDWRREQPQERRGRRNSDDLNSISDNPHSRNTKGVPRGPKIANGRTRSRSVAAPEPLNTNISADKMALANRRSSTSFHPTPMSPAVSGNAFTLPARQALKEIEPSKLTRDTSKSTNVQQGPGTVDPRLKAQNQRAMAGQDLVNSPTTLSGDETNDSKEYAWFIKNLAVALVERGDARRQSDHQTKRLATLEEELKNTQKLFPAGNSYIDQLQHELSTMKANHESQQTKLLKKEEKIEAAMQAVRAYSKKQDAVPSEVQELKSRLLEQHNHIKRRDDEYETLQKQFSQLARVVDTLKSEVNQEKSLLHSKDQTQANYEKRLALYETRIKRLEDQDINSLRSDVKAQKLSLAQLNDAFAPQDSLRSLDARVDQLSKDLSSTVEQVRPPSSDIVTQAQLNSYVTLFNTFEANIDKRFSTMKDQQKVTTADLKDYVANELSKHQEASAQNKGGDVENDKRLNDLEATSKLFSEDIKQHKELIKAQQEYTEKFKESFHMVSNREAIKLNKTADSINKISQLVQANEARYNDQNGLPAQCGKIAARVGLLETAQKRHEQLSLNNENQQKTHQRQFGILQGILNRLDESSRGNTHAIDVLNQRFDNITTDQLVRQMAGVIEPMLASIKPQVQELSTRLPQIQSVQDMLQACSNSTTDTLVATNALLSELKNTVIRISESRGEADDRLAGLEQGAKAMRQQFPDLEKLDTSIKAVQDNINSVKDWTQTAINQSVSAINQSVAEVKTNTMELEKTIDTRMNEVLAEVKESTSNAINATKEEQRASMVNLLDEVREARNSIDARLVHVEAGVKQNRNEEPASTITKIEVPQKSRLSSVSGTAPTQSPSSRSTASTPSTSSETKVVTGKETYLQPNVSNGNMSKVSPLAKHFQNQSDDDMNDTIVITQNPAKNAARHRAKADIISISESDPEGEEIDMIHNERNEDLNGEHYIKPKQPLVNIGGWTKPPPSTKSSSNKSKGHIPAVSSNREDHAVGATAESPMRVKRKRDNSNASSKSGRHGTNSTSSTPTSSQNKKKKKKT